MKQKKWIRFIGKYWLLVFLCLMWICFSIILPNYIALSNVMNILGATCISALAALGLTAIMTAGEIDFSAGTQVSAATAVLGTLLASKTLNSFALGAIVTMLIFAVIGCLNAFLHVKLKMPAFIATMGMSYLLKGLIKKYIGGSVTYRAANWPDNYTLLGQGRIGGVVPYTILVLVIVSALMYVFTEKTRWGKSLYAVGSNPINCDYLGINRGKQKTIGFVLCSVLSAFAGIVLSSQLNASGISVGDTMLESITILMLGSTFIKQGVFNVAGTLISAFMLQSLFYGMKMMGAGAWVEDLVQGLILIVAVAVVTIIRHRIGRTA